MRRNTRITTACVVLAVSVVLGIIGAVLARRADSGLTAHLFVPATLHHEPPTLAALGPPTTDELQPGLRFESHAPSWVDKSMRREPRPRVANGVTSIGTAGRAPFEAKWSGYLLITESGLYRFRLRGVQDLSFALDGRQLGGIHTILQRRFIKVKDVVSVHLEAGLHPLSIEQVAVDRPHRGSPFEFEWSFGGPRWRTIPADNLWSAPTETGWTEPLPPPHLPPDAPEHDDYVDQHLVGIRMPAPGLTGSHAVYAAFADRWDFERFRLLGHFPGYEVLWRGKLLVTEEREYHLVAQTPGAVQIRLGGASVEAVRDVGGAEWSGELDPGWHDLSVSFVSPWPSDTLEISWDGEGSELRPISASRLQPLERDAVWFAARHRFATIVIVLGILGALVALAWLWKERPDGVGEVHLGFRRGAYALALCLIMLLGLGLRLHRYNEVPHLLSSWDELHNARKGWDLMHGDSPRGWTPIRYMHFYDEDQIEHTQWIDSPMDRVDPNFDRPPLFPLLHGMFNAAIGGAENMWALGPAKIRIFPILLAVLTIPLVAALSRRLYGKPRAALMAALLFATVPAIVLNHRQAKSDLLVALLVMLGLLAAFRHLDTDKRRWLWAAALAAGLATWSKEIGVVAVAIVPYVWLREKRWRDGFTVAIAAGTMFALYFVWGSWLDYEMFWNIVGGQAGQASAFDAGWRFLTQAQMYDTLLPFTFGWILWLWFAVVDSAGRDELPALAAVCFLIIISSVVRINFIFGWYWVPIFPFLCMAGGLYLHRMLRKPGLIRGTLFVLTALMMAIHAERSGGAEALTLTRGLVVITLFPFAVASFFPSRWTLSIGRAWAVLVILAALTLGGIQLTHYEEPIGAWAQPTKYSGARNGVPGGVRFGVTSQESVEEPNHR